MAESENLEIQSKQDPRTTQLPHKYNDYDIDPRQDILWKDPKLWRCRICKHWLSSKESLRRHILTQHIKQAVHQCELCYKTFILSTQLLEHMKEHHKARSDACEQLCLCGRLFSKRNSLLSHIRRFHHAAPTVRPTCSICHKVFNDSATKRVHEARVHGEKVVRCEHPGCGKMFSTQGLKNAHLRYHENREFECSVCNKTFSTSSYRDKHELLHQGIRQYACDDCGREFITASQLNKHRKREHLHGP
ncbi:zinc finger protein 479 [Hyalella azteca]|uniref:Zinc finger protein 479 n=1 Tax=Hyalella azteca TaxID=294128 RepID=A0A8B7NE61_HYAAZ|nr:zinc finger protein 479 [Hyalella azteca]